MTGPEKRREPRYPTDANVEILGRDNQKTYAVCGNISRSGIMLMASQRFQPEEQLQLKILEAGRLILASATVRHCYQDARGFRIGCSAEFSEAS